MEVRSVCLGLPQSLLTRFCHGIWVRDLGSIARWWAIPRSVSEHLLFPSALIVFQKLRCITSNVRNKPPPRRAPPPALVWLLTACRVARRHFRDGLAECRCLILHVFSIWIYSPHSALFINV